MEFSPKELTDGSLQPLGRKAEKEEQFEVKRRAPTLVVCIAPPTPIIYSERHIHSTTGGRCAHILMDALLRAVVVSSQ